MVFEKHCISDDTEVNFRLETDENGQLVSQEKIMKRRDGGDIYFSIKRPEMVHKDEVLYHVTRLENIKEIRESGLKPRVGNCYANHWLSMSGDIFDDIQK